MLKSFRVWLEERQAADVAHHLVQVLKVSRNELKEKPIPLTTWDEQDLVGSIGALGLQPEQEEVIKQWLHQKHSGSTLQHLLHFMKHTVGGGDTSQEIPGQNAVLPPSNQFPEKPQPKPPQTPQQPNMSPPQPLV